MDEIKRIYSESFDYEIGHSVLGHPISQILDQSISQPIFTLYTEKFIKVMTIYPKETVRVIYYLKPLTE